MKKMSVIVPCYNEEEVLNLFYKEIDRISKEMKKLEFEFVFIDDGSKDNTLEIVKDLRKKDKRVRYVSFSRNFGKESGVYAGLKAAKGDYAVVIDADLQHDPDLIKEMYEIIENEGYETVAVKRFNRKGEGLRAACSNLFFKLMSKLSQVSMVKGEMDYRMMSRKMIDAILSMAEYNRFSKGIFSWVGFETKWLEQEDIERSAGTTKWSFKSLFKYSIQGLTAFSTVPLVLASFIGLIFFVMSIIAIIFIIIKTLLYGDPVAGYPTLICVIFFVSGIQLLCFGIIGEYLSKMYLEIKNRPIYIAKETSEDDK